MIWWDRPWPLASLVHRKNRYITIRATFRAYRHPILQPPARLTPPETPQEFFDFGLAGKK